MKVLGMVLRSGGLAEVSSALLDVLVADLSFEMSPGALNDVYEASAVLLLFNIVGISLHILSYCQSNVELSLAEGGIVGRDARRYPSCFDCC